MSTTNAFASFIPETRQPRNLDSLPEGQHLVKIGTVDYQTDRIDGIEKDWTDENDVLYVFLHNDDGIFHCRFYWNGYWKFSELINAKEFREDLRFYRRTKIDNVRDYAIDTRTNCRVPSEKNSKIARQLLSEFCTAAGDGKACPIEELEDKELWIELKKENVFGEARMKLLRVARVSTGFKTGFKGSQKEVIILPETLDGEITAPAF